MLAVAEARNVNDWQHGQVVASQERCVILLKTDRAISESGRKVHWPPGYRVFGVFSEMT